MSVREDFDYVLHEPEKDGYRRVVGVKDGVETPLSEHEVAQMNREHDAEKCRQCSFVPNLDELLLYKVSRELREEATKKPYCLGKFTMPGWSGHSYFYMFKCQNCNAVRVDYPHGYTGGGYLYLRCNGCNHQLVLHEKRLYENEGMPAPPGFWKSLFIMWRLKRRVRKTNRNFAGQVAKIEDMGVKVVVVPKKEGDSSRNLES